MKYGHKDLQYLELVPEASLLLALLQNMYTQHAPRFAQGKGFPMEVCLSCVCTCASGVHMLVCMCE